jgi:hypothetical protein
MKIAEDNGQFSYTPVKFKDDDDENFNDVDEAPSQSTTAKV